MAKKVNRIVKLQLQAGKATPAPPVGTVLGPTGINMGEFCTQFNAKSQDRMGEIVPCVLSIYEDKTFDFKLKTAPASFMIKQAVGIPKGSGKNVVRKVGKITKKQVMEIAEAKMKDLNARDVNEAAKIIMGSARSMGVEVTE